MVRFTKANHLTQIGDHSLADESQVGDLYTQSHALIDLSHRHAHPHTLSGDAGLLCPNRAITQLEALCCHWRTKVCWMRLEKVEGSVH